MTTPSRSRAGDEREHEAARRTSSPQQDAPHQHDASCHHLDAPAPAPGLSGLARAAETAGGDVSGGKDAAPDVRAAIRRRVGRGEALPSSVSDDLGSRMGTDFGHVRVHADGEADTIARSVQAKAFTLGSDIYFSKGTYAPGTSGGQSLLAHELTHVKQHAEGRSGGGGTMRVGRTDDPAEREAEQVARTIAGGGSVASGGPVVTGGPAVRRTVADGVIRRDPTVKEKVKSNAEMHGTSGAESVPFEFNELAATVMAFQDHSVHEITDSWEGNAHLSAPGGLVSGARDAVFAGAEMHKGRMNLKADNSIEKNLGAQQVQTGTQDMAGALVGMPGGVAGLSSKMIGEHMPGMDVATNITQATIKGKKAIEDTVAAEKLRHKGHDVKRDQDQAMPVGVRSTRFKGFVDSLRKGSGSKRSDRKRWPQLHKDWVKHLNKTNADPTLYDLNDPAPDAAAKLKGTAAGAGGPFNPLTSAWTANPTNEEIAFLDWLRVYGIKDFGYGTEVREEYEETLHTGDERTRTGNDEYEGLRDVGKVTSFGHRRKGEMAAVGAVEVAGHSLDAAGTLTAAGDMGATKLTGKIIKAGVAAYKGTKQVVKRGRRVHKVRTAKNEAEYGGKGAGDSKRGVWWGTKQFFGGNLEGSMDKVKAAAHATADHDAWTNDPAKQQAHAAWVAKKQAYDAEQAAIKARRAKRREATEGKIGQDLIDARAAFKKANPKIAKKANRLADPGEDQAPEPERAAKSTKLLDAAGLAKIDRKLTLQCTRRIDDLLRCLVSINAKVRERAKEVVHIIAETNLAGAIQKIDDADLEWLFHNKDDANQRAAYDKRMNALREMISTQLKGIGG